jgi:hypothetical protein
LEDDNEKERKKMTDRTKTICPQSLILGHKKKPHVLKPKREQL